MYKKRRGTATMHGQLFELKFCALAYLRAKNKGYKFKLGSNVEEFGLFDDVFVEYFDDNFRKKHIFVQLRSTIKTRIAMRELLTERGTFSLCKFYKSYMQIEEKFNDRGGDKLEGSIGDSLFIIYTNADVEQNLKSYNDIDFSQEEFLMTGGSVLHFNEEEHKAIYQHLQELHKHREFLSRFRICYSQANEKEMDSHIKSELQKIMKLRENELDIAYMYFRDFITDWWQNSNFFLQGTISRKYDPLRKTLQKLRRSF
jgi:hypothetical protein